MATSTCLKCNNTSFEMKRASVRNTDHGYWFVQCSNCGGVVGVVPEHDTNTILGRQNRVLNAMAAQMGFKADLPT